MLVTDLFSTNASLFESQILSMPGVQPAAFLYAPNSDKRLLAQTVDETDSTVSQINLFDPLPVFPGAKMVNALYAIKDPGATLTWLIADSERGTLAYAMDSKQEQKFLTFDV
jgi:hypothetical protein